MTKIVFFGTPEYVIPIPEALKKSGHEIVAVITQPPKPVGRKKILTPSPVAQWAEKHKIPVLTNYTPLHRNVWKALPAGRQADVGILAAYGRIIPKEVIELFPHGILNIHPSLLPKYRGASPVQAAIMAGEKQTGVTIIKLDEEVDHGPIVHQFKEPIREDDTTGTLRARLFKNAANELIKILPLYLERRILPKEQEHEMATFTTLIKKSDGFIKPQDVTSALQVFDSEVVQIFDSEITQIRGTRGGDPLQTQQLEHFIRAMQPWPGAYTNIKLTRYQASKITRLKILSAHIKDGRLILDQVQLEGKNPVSWKQFKEGYPKISFQNSVKV